MLSKIAGLLLVSGLGFAPLNAALGALPECGTVISRTEILQIVNAYPAPEWLSSDRVMGRMESCPSDPGLARLLFVALLREGRCAKGKGVLKTFVERDDGPFGIGAWVEVGYCFYGTRRYVDAVETFDVVDSLKGGFENLFNRLTYAKALYRYGESRRAERVVKEITSTSYASLRSQIDKAAYMGAIVLYANILYSEGHYDRSFHVVDRVLNYTSANIPIMEAMLKSAARSSNLSNDVLARVYCMAVNNSLDVLSTSSRQVRSALEKIRRRIGSKSQTLQCK